MVNQVKFRRGWGSSSNGSTAPNTTSRSSRLDFAFDSGLDHEAANFLAGCARVVESVRTRDQRERSRLELDSARQSSPAGVATPALPSVCVRGASNQRRSAIAIALFVLVWAAVGALPRLTRALAGQHVRRQVEVRVTEQNLPTDAP